MTEQRHRAREILNTVSRAYPHAWRLVDQMRAERGKTLPDWPQWCFLPLHGAYAIVSGGGDHEVPYERSHHVAIVGALAAWRVTQGIYRFDPALYEALIDTALDRELPREPLYRLPEWCVYLETPGLVWAIAGEVRPIHGVWAHLDWDERIAGRPHHELRLVLDTAPTPADALDPVRGCLPIPLILGEGTIADALERVLASGAEQAAKRGLAVPAGLVDASRVAPTLWPVVSLLLYLCSEEPEIGETGRRPSNPRPTRTKAGERLFAAERISTWDVGVRLGTALRAAYQRSQVQDDENAARGRMRPRPHIRRAHWHTFLAGAGRSERRLKWLPPVPVNLDDVSALPATVRPVGPFPEDKGGGK